MQAPGEGRSAGSSTAVGMAAGRIPRLQEKGCGERERLRAATRIAPRSRTAAPARVSAGSAGVGKVSKRGAGRMARKG